ncbi:MAG TPA: winged helix-turn-helix domain-containing protein [Candidatus Sulfotelmatobacter sp.]|nr:winged helix-turn-helix domain-containing protein [Candidatus Sulfotelmatobacter sp.]
MKTLKLVLADSTYEQITRYADHEGIEASQCCSIILTDWAVTHTHANSETVRTITTTLGGFGKVSRSKPKTRVGEPELMNRIIALLKKNGGAMAKTDVEETLFEEYKDLFQNGHYAECVGDDVPRWKKNVQFARNTARKLGLIKLPEESGRGMWQLTEKGRQWKIE